ncbi:LysE family translocator [Neorhizobium huautlense]|uniref:LysE family translocator n=1 Tax=Neorhizobium huautlense TaxID=67774 RepID=UPI001FE0A88D|nr:LysE family translocator [Neorhizobium huautlense]
MRYALTAPRRVPIAAAMGTITGTFCWGLAGWLGINVLFQAAPFAYVALKTAGGLYLVWLGAKIFLDVRRARHAADLTAQRVDMPLKTAYRMGLATNLANPKSALFVASLFCGNHAGRHPFLLWLDRNCGYACRLDRLLCLPDRPHHASGNRSRIYQGQKEDRRRRRPDLRGLRHETLAVATIG